MKIKYSRTIVMGVMGIFSVLLFALALAQASSATTIGTDVSTVNLTATGNTTLGNNSSDTVTVQGATTVTPSATGLLNILTGNLKIGDATPNITQNGEDAFIEGTLEVTGTTAFALNGTEQMMLTSDLAGTIDGLVRVVGIPSSTAGTTTGILVGQNSSANTNGLDTAIQIDNMDDDLALATGISIVSTGGGAITTAIDLATTAIATDIKFQNSDTLDNNTDATFTFKRDTAGIVTIIGADNTSPADTTFTTTGAGAITIGTTGSGNTTSITLATDSTGDGEIVLPTDAISTGEITDNTITATDLNATLTFADADLVDFAAILHDDATAQGLRLPNVGASPIDVTGTNEGYVAWDQTNNRLLINDGTSWGAVVGATTTIADNTTDALDIQESTNNYINVNTTNASENISFGNATTNPSFSFLGSGIININGSITGAASLSPDITSAANENLQMLAGGTGDIVLTADSNSNVRAVAATAAPSEDLFYATNTGLGFTAANIDTMAVELATATGVGANNSALHAILLNAPVDASDVINGIEITGVAQTVASTTQNLIFVDPAASGNTNGTLIGISIDSLTANTATETALSIGSGWDTDVSFIDTSVIISVANGGSFTFNDSTAGNNLLAMTDAGAIAIGSSAVGTTSVTIATDSTGDGEVTVPNESISAAEITNVTRSINIGVGEFINLTAGASLDAAAADTKPDFASLNSGLVIEYDDTAGTIDTDYLGVTVTIPQDWASGGTVAFTVSQDAATVTNTESIQLAALLQPTSGAADTVLTTFTSVNLTSSTDIQVVTFDISSESLAAGKVVQLRTRQGNTLADDTVYFYGAEFRYTAVQ